MRFISAFVTLLGLAWAAPIDNAPMENPVLAPLGHTAQQLGIVVRELNKYNGNDPRQADQIIRHGQETLRTLDAALKPLREQRGAFDWTTTLALASPLLSLDTEMHQLATVLKTKKDIIDRDRMTPLVFNLLRQTQIQTKELCDRIVQNLPVGVSAAVGLFAAEIESTIKGIVDVYKPPADVTVIVADPNHPFSGGFSIQPANAPQPYNSQSPYNAQPFPPQQQGPYLPQQVPQGLQGPQGPQQQQQQPPPWYRPNPTPQNVTPLSEPRNNNNQVPPPGFSWSRAT